MYRAAPFRWGRSACSWPVLCKYSCGSWDPCFHPSSHLSVLCLAGNIDSSSSSLVSAFHGPLLSERTLYPAPSYLSNVFSGPPPPPAPSILSSSCTGVLTVCKRHHTLSCLPFWCYQCPSAPSQLLKSYNLKSISNAIPSRDRKSSSGGLLTYSGRTHNCLLRLCNPSHPQLLPADHILTRGGNRWSGSPARLSAP